MTGVLGEDGAGLLGVVDGEAGEENQADGGDEHEGGLAGGEDHEEHFGDDEDDEADAQNGARLQQIDLGGHAEHGEGEEEAGAQCEGDADGAEVIDGEDHAE